MSNASTIAKLVNEYKACTGKCVAMRRGRIESRFRALYANVSPALRASAFRTFSRLIGGAEA